ncbi:MAG TPA: YggS family pyridoxal phosphate-dependent enzyme [Thermomicrobiales bacterium]|nr:YggS family pyridoxal phosphate-dependent enzyme [Thermomicrobiales bacterium]
MTDQATQSDATEHAAAVARVRDVQDRVYRAAGLAGRDAESVTIVGVSKTFPRELVDAAYEAGLRVFAESRVQEAREKFATPLPDDASLHMIGQLQTNKVKQAVGVFSCIESVDRANLIESLANEAARRDLVVPILLQVNIAREPQKSGCDPDDVNALVDLIASRSSLRCDGLMTIAPLVVDPEDARLVFRDLRLLRDRLRERHPGMPLEMLSMGMSGDFEVAIAEGATHVRIGRALFGAR